MADPGRLVIRRSCCRANTAPSRTSAVGSTARSSNRSRRAHPSPPRGIPCRLGYRAINWRGYRAAQRQATMQHAAGAVLFALCAATMHAHTWSGDGRRGVNASASEPAAGGSTPPGGKLQCGRYWTWRDTLSKLALTISPSAPPPPRWRPRPGPNGPCQPPAWLGVRAAHSRATAGDWPAAARTCPVPS